MVATVDLITPRQQRPWTAHCSLWRMALWRPWQMTCMRLVSGHAPCVDICLHRCWVASRVHHD